MKLKLIISAALLASVPMAHAFSFSPHNLYAGAEMGYSMGDNLDMQPTAVCSPGGACWDNAQQSFVSGMGNSLLFGAKVGYHFNSLVGMDINYDDRNDFSWAKFFPGVIGGFPDARYRQINHINIQTLMLDVSLYPNLQWAYIDPFVSAGVGEAWNRTGELITSDLVTGGRGIIAGDTSSNLAWQVGLGTNIIASKNVFFDVGYRFVSVGKVQTGTSVTDAGMTLPIPRVREGNAYLNEIYAGINFSV